MRNQDLQRKPLDAFPKQSTKKLVPGRVRQAGKPLQNQRREAQNSTVAVSICKFSAMSNGNIMIGIMNNSAYMVDPARQSNAWFQGA